jgi:hypothetical protein
MWSILIATLASRQQKFLRLMDTLLPQITETTENIEVVACYNNGEWPIGHIRQALMEEAQGTYISFLDDDDAISNVFVTEILKALEAKPDVVGFYMQYLESGQFIANSYHSLKHYPHNDSTGFYRDVTHQQPVRRELALQSDFRGWPEDSTWREGVRPLLKTEVYIDKCLYFYQHDWSDTIQGNLKPHTFTPRPTINNSVFRWLELT